ncbi:MAG TPA: hypothetical protein VGS41_08775, partial [Chthonomonadales bacterium]|nr:hypothetical protein [Chthonomonadales bacterium]
MSAKAGNDLCCCGNVCRRFQNGSPGISCTTQEFTDGGTGRAGVHLTFQSLDDPCQHVHVGIGPVSIRARAAEAFRQTTNLMFLL